MQVYKKIDCPGLGDKIYRAIQNDPRTTQQIATASEISTTTLYNLMNEKYWKIDFETIEKLERILNVNFNVKF